MSDLFGMMARATYEHEQEGEKLHDMMTWLPSYAAAKKHFGDYASDQIFHRKDIMVEATKVLSVLSGYNIQKHEALEWFYVNPGTLMDAERDVPSEEERLDFIKSFFQKQFRHEIDITEDHTTRRHHKP